MHLVGAGPGDAGLLTLRGRRLLESADVVVYDQLVGRGILAWARAGARMVAAGRDGVSGAAKQRAVNRLLKLEARGGRCVVRLKGGDPVLFGRGAEEALALVKAGIRCEIVPGVTSAVAVPSSAGIPVTHRALASSVGILTGHEDPSKGRSRIRWEHLAKGCDTLVCLMAVKRLPQVVRQLRRHGVPDGRPAAVIERGTTAAQRTVTGTLGTIVARAARARVRPPAILIVGEVVRLRAGLKHLERAPLFGRRILVTRAAGRAERLVGELESLGAEVEHIPAIAQKPVRALGLFRKALARLGPGTWVVFSSPEGPGWCLRVFRRCGADVRALAGCRIGAIGPKTAEAVRAIGLRVDFVPARYSQEGILRGLPRRLHGQRAVLLCAQGSREALPDGLRRRGMAVERVPVYRTVIPHGMVRDVRRAFTRPFDAVLVTSASCVEHLRAALARAGLSRRMRELPFVSIGPVTSAAVRRSGGRVRAEASVSTIEGLMAALRRRAGGRRRAR